MRRRLAGRWPRVLLGALMIVAALALAACGDDDDGGDEGGGDTGNIEAQEVIRFAFAPDPVWNYIVDSGILEEKGVEAGIDINAFQSFDEFGLFAGGNADILSTGSYETPLLDEQGIETVTFGKYNANKDVFAIAADNPAKTAADLDEGCKVAAESTTGNTVIWSGLVNQIDGRTIEEGGDDLELVTADYQVMPQLLSDGEVCAAILDPVQGTEALRTNQIKALYDGQSASQLYAEEVADDPNHLGVDSNNFVARKEWFDEHPEEVAFFLDVWQEGMDEWTKNSDQIIADYPEDFAVQSPEDEKFMQDYVKDVFNFQQKSVYLTPEWVENEEGVFDLIQEAGVIEEDTVFPEHAIIDPKTGEVTETIGGSEE
jgi:ABC-type nitrate/sulfonate/bicarbonate transport system substrate-binding protein